MCVTIGLLIYIFIIRDIFLATAPRKKLAMSFTYTCTDLGDDTMKNRSVAILIVALLLLTVLSVSLVVLVEHAHDEFKEDVTVRKNGVTEERLSVRGLSLVPTEKREYEIDLTCVASGSFDVILDYEEKADGGLKNFVNVSVKADGQLVYQGRLSDLLDRGDVIRFEGELKEKEPLVVTICYEMPRETGNEAQKTSADFDIKLRIEKI